MDRKRMLVIFLAIEGILYSSYMFLDIANCFLFASNVIKFCSIVICFLMSLYIFVHFEHFVSRGILCIALGFTVLADVFLLFTEKYLYGVLCFFVVQLLYLIRLLLLKTQLSRIHWRVQSIEKKRTLFGQIIFQICLRMILCVSLLAVFYFLKISIDPLFIAVVLYMIYFSVNLMISFVVLHKDHYQQSRTSLLFFSIGLLLYFICDLMVGLYNAGDMYSIQTEFLTALHTVSGIGMWLFYLPGQIFITLS